MSLKEESSRVPKELMDWLSTGENILLLLEELKKVIEHSLDRGSKDKEAIEMLEKECHTLETEKETLRRRLDELEPLDKLNELAAKVNGMVDAIQKCPALNQANTPPNPA